MADSKLSELTAATGAAGTDTTYLVQSSTSNPFLHIFNNNVISLHTFAKGINNKAIWQI